MFCVFQMKLDRSFEISPLEESRHLHHVCDHCSYSTADKSNFNKHIRRHTAKIVAVTDTATSSFSKAKISNKDEHQGDTDTHLCQTCGKTFKSKFGLSLHIKNKHTCMQIYIGKKHKKFIMIRQHSYNMYERKRKRSKYKRNTEYST